MRKYSWAPFVIIPIVIIAIILFARWNYYGATGTAYSAPDRPLTDVPVELAARSERLAAVDNPTVSEGVVVVDYSHSNAFFIEELNTLFSKVVARGFSVEVLLNPELAEEEEPQGLADKLRYAKALVLPVPRIEYTADEVLAIENFVERGGRVFIIGDPTRTVVVEALNSIASSFGIIFSNDYLYSLENNDNNYRNVVYTNFSDSPITAGLDDSSKVILYSGSSVNAPGYEVILGDDSVESSTSEGGRERAAAVLTTEGQVLAIGDLTFFGEPYSAAENNGTLINNIADFLTSGQPEFKLTDFPIFFNTNVDIVFDDPLIFNNQFENAATLKEFLEAEDHTVNFVNEMGNENDVIFVGRYDAPENVAEFLEAANIAILPAEDEEELTEEELAEEAGEESEEDGEAEEGEGEEMVEADIEDVALVSDAPLEEEEEDLSFVEGRIQIEGIGELEQGGSSLFYLHQEDNRNILIILSDNSDTNEAAFDLLLDNELINCQAAPQIAVCQTEDPEGEKLPPSLRSNRIDKILVVADDDGKEQNDAQTSALEYQDAFSQTTYNTLVWSTTDEGSPDLDVLLDHDAVIWTTGDYWDDSIGADDTQLLMRYLELGGNLILSGSSIGFDWDHTEFLAGVAHADYLDFGEPKDIEISLPDHPIAFGFDEDTVIELLDTPSEEPLNSDIVNYTSDARVIFRLGSDSQAPEAPAIIAYEDDRVKVAYYALPVYMLPPAERAQLVINTVDWFTRSALDLPSEFEYEPYELPEDFGDSGSSSDDPTGEGDGEGSEDEGDETLGEEDGAADDGSGEGTDEGSEEDTSGEESEEDTGGEESEDTSS